MRGQRTLLLGLTLCSFPLGAQPVSVESARRDLINRAEHARGSGDHPSALDLGTRAGAIRMTPSLQLLLAQEHDAVGHALDALDHAQRCVHEAEADEGVRNRGAILAACTTLRDVLTTRVGRLIVRVPGASSGVQIRVDGAELAGALWNVPVPMLPAAVRIEATSADGRRFEREVRVEQGAVEEVEVTFGEGQRHALTQGELPTRIEAPHGVATALPRPARVGAGPWVLAGVGVASFGLAAALWGLHGAALRDRDSACDAAGCDPIAQSLDERVRSLTLGTNVMLGVGTAAAASAGLWFLLARPRAEAPAPGLRRALIVPTNGGLLLAAEGCL